MMTQPEKIKLPPYQAYNASGADWTNSIPEHWNIRRLRNSLFRHTSGVWGADPDGINDLPCLRVADFNRSQWGIKVDNPTTRAITPLERQGKIIRAGNLLLEKSGGGDKQAVGTVVLYDHDLEATCSNFIEILVVQGNFDPRYLKFVHSTLYALGVNKRSIKQTTGIQNIDLYNYLSEKFPVPPPDEQAAIVRFLDHADEQIQRYIASKKRLIALLEEERQALIHQAVTRGLDPTVRLKPSGVECLGDVPEHWEIRPLKRWVSTKITDGPHETPVLLEEGIPFMSAEAMVGGRLDFNRRRGLISREQHELCCRKCSPQINDIFMCKSGATTGKVAIVDTTKEFSIWSPLALIRVDPQKVLAYLLFEVLETKYVQQQIEKHWSYGTQPNLAMNTMERIAVMLPPIAEQKKLLTYLDKATQKIVGTIDRAPRQIELMEEYRTRLIADVVTGQLDVREAAAQLQEAPWAGRRRTELRNE